MDIVLTLEKNFIESNVLQIGIGLPFNLTLPFALLVAGFNLYLFI